MSNKQMTAVDWLYQEITKKSVNDQSHNVLGIFKQAKELENQQIIDAHCDGQSIKDTSGFSDAEQYYTETYGGQNND